jgi:hypothetical protein
MQSDQIDKLAEALAKAQAAITSPPRNREVSVKGETKAGKEFTYTFKYATLDGIIDHVRAPLTENGLWFTQTLANGDGKYRLVTRLLHSSGQWIAGETPLFVKPNKFGDVTNQEFGSALTYMKRYALAAILGVAADEDDDANAADGNTVESSKDRTPANAPAMKNKLAAVTSGAKVPDPKPEPPVALSEAALKEAAKMIRKELDKAPDMATVEEIKTHHATTLTAIKASSPKLHAWTLESATAMEAA